MQVVNGYLILVHHKCIFFWCYPFACMDRILFREFCSKIKNDCGIINPGEHNDDRDSSAIGDGKRRIAEIMGDVLFSCHERNGGENRTNHQVFSVRPGIRQKSVYTIKQAAGDGEYQYVVDHYENNHQTVGENC